MIRPAVFHRTRFKHALLALLPLAMAFAPLPSSAQVVIGGSQPAVSVDESVLEQLGPGPTLPGMLLPRLGLPQDPSAARPAQPGAGQAATGGVHLMPPRAAAKPSAKAAKPARSADTDADTGKSRKGKSKAKAEPTSEDVRITSAPETPKDEPKPAQPVASAPAAPVPLSASPAQPTPAAPPTAPVTATPAQPMPPAQPVATPTAPSKPTQTAAVVPPGSVAREDGLSITFGTGGTVLPEPAKADLKKIADRLAKEADLRVQLLAYADANEAPGDSAASKARRLSLSRALAVRSQLIDYGLRSTRIDVRALGDAAQDGPADRVDLQILKR